jgi:ribonuclease HI
MAEWRENQLPTPIERPEHWVMYFDGSLNLEGAGVEVLLISPTGEQLKYVLQIFLKVSNNEAEYEALLHGLRLAASLGIKQLLVYGNSAMVINQVNKSWDRNKENMDAYCLEVRKLENKFYGLEFHHVIRDNNVAVDVLSKLGSTRAQVPAGVFIHELHAPSIPEPAPSTTVPAHPPTGQKVMMIDVDWRQPFIDYLSEQKVPSDKNLAEQLIRRAKSYVLVGDKLYRRGASLGVLINCVPDKKAKTSWRRSIKASAATTRPLTRWSASLSDEPSTGPQLWATPKNSSACAKGASTSPRSNTSQPTSWSPYRQPGLSPAGGST